MLPYMAMSFLVRHFYEVLTTAAVNIITEAEVIMLTATVVKTEGNLQEVSK